MDTIHLILLFLAVGLIAFLYSSVGHAGASGYIATMTLFGLAPTVIRPTALVLNMSSCFFPPGGWCFAEATRRKQSPPRGRWQLVPGRALVFFPA